MNTWVLKDKIKRGIIYFGVSDEVICFCRKNNGHPKSIKDSIVYTVRRIDTDGHIYVAENSTDGWLQEIRVHKTYMIPLYIIRDIKLNSILNETN